MLAQIQLQLEQHFSALAAVRKPLSYPVYALEHGLDTETIKALAQAASDELRKFGLVDAHWLVWSALAAEAGYRYAGEEFWPTLEVVQDEWRNNNNRKWLRARFRRFRDKFGGPVPVGRWADQFTNISWPIAHAILPLYLQDHFAQRLHALCFDLANAASADASTLGGILCEDYDGASSRFADFLQQVDLTGQIILALRDEDIGDAVARIAPALLTRIVTDLETRRDSKDYLRAARKVISAHHASVSPGLRGSQAARESTGMAVGAIIGPRLAARRMGETSIILGLIFPDFAAALERAGIAQSALMASRIALAGPDSRPEPALSLLTFSKRDRQLDTLPAAGVPIITLETADVTLRQVLDPLLTIPEQGCWVLRRRADGLFCEVIGGHVRTGHSYAIVVRSAWPDGMTRSAGLDACKVSAAGVVAYTLDVGDHLPDDQRIALAALGISAATGTRIEPIGLAPSFPEPARLATWCVTEPVTLRVAADFDAMGFAVSLDDTPPEALSADGGVLLLALDPLALGPHHIRFQALSCAGDVHSAIGETASFPFHVAAPRPWQLAMRAKAGFHLLVDPPGATLEDLFAVRAALTLFGPAGRSVAWSLETYDAAGHLAASGSGTTTRVGGDAKAVAAMLDRLRQAHSDAIDSAHRVDIIASLGELGRQALAFPHYVAPLRWHFDPRTHEARLIDETSHEAPVTVRSYSLASPLEKQAIAYDDAIAGTRVAPPGESLVADYESKRYALFASAPQSERFHGFADLGLAQSLLLAKPEVEGVLILLSALIRWHRARPVGVQAIVRKTMTLDRIDAEIARRACGRDFTIALAQQEAKPLSRAQSMVGGSPGFGWRMRNFPVPASAAAGLAMFSDAAALYKVETDTARCADAYTLAFDPVSLRFGNGDSARARTAALIANRSLIRGAYLARTAVRAGAQAPIVGAG